jgi:hypothetical protein
MHLEHRISQRLLGRLQSQGFVYNDLSRACLAQTAGSLPLVYLIARLCLYGDHAARLHEDVIAVCAEWTRPELRKAGLTPIDPKRMDEVEYLRRLDDALLLGEPGKVSDTIRDELLASCRRDVDELKGYLERKAEGLEAKVRKELAAAGEKEAEGTRALLEDQARRIDRALETWDRQDAATRADAEARRAKLGPTLFPIARDIPAEEKLATRERASERKAMLRRKDDIPREIQEEPDRIRRRYAVQTVRLEPVGIVYLWPEMG